MERRRVFEPYRTLVAKCFTKSSRIGSLRRRLDHRCSGAKEFVSLGMLAALSAFAQGSLAPTHPSKEYIRLNGQVIAIENQPFSASSGALSFSPTSVSFGSQPFLTAGTPQQITVTNSGTVALPITSIQATGTDASDFSVSGCATSLAAGASCVISATFTPGGAGTRSASLVIAYNGTGSPQSLPLSGTGVIGTSSNLFFTGFQTGSAPFPYTGWAGTSFTVGLVPVTVTAVGRIYAPNNSQSHRVRLIDASTNTEVGSTTVTPSNGVLNTITYAPLEPAVQLNALGTYYLMSQENGVDDIYFAGVSGTPNSLFINSGLWSFGSGGSGNGDYGPVGMVTQTTATASTPLVTGLQLGMTNYGSGWEGNAFTVGSSPVTVTQLGRIYATGNSQSHTVKLVDATTNQDVPGSTVTVTPSGVQGQVTYVALSKSLTLPAGGQYFLVSSETALSNGKGDQYYDDSPVYGTATGISITNGVLSYDPNPQTFLSFGGAGHSYGPVSLLTSAPTSNGALITQYDSTRNDLTGWVGASFTVGSMPAWVGALGRIFISQNTQSHVVKLVNASSGQDVNGSAVTVTPAGAVPGIVKYAGLPSAVMLAANTTYYLVSQETSGGDQWYESAVGAGYLPQAVVNGGGYFSAANPTTWVPQGSTSIYGPVSLIFESGTIISGSAPAISNVETMAVGGTSEIVTWTTDQPATSQVSYGSDSSYGSSTTVDSNLVTSHSVTITNLNGGGSYNYAVTSANASGTASTSSNSTFSVTPYVGYLAYWGVNNSGVTISWSTDVAATTQIAYGTTSALEQLWPLDSNLTTSHGTVLSGLNSGTTYYFRALSTTAGGSIGGSTVYSFTTSGSPSAPAPVISAVTSANITTTSATITWTTDQAASSQVNYGTTTAYSASTQVSNTQVTSHSMALTGLTPGTTYHFDVASANSAGASSTSGDTSFTTAAVAPAAVITNVSAMNVTSNSVTITWTTDQATTSQVKYGSTTAYGSSTPMDSSMLTSHSVTVTGLTASTTYDFSVVSTDAAGLSTSSPNATFTTPATNAVAPYVGYVAAWGINNSGATVSWSTDVPANAQLAYGTTPALGHLVLTDPTLTTSHGAVLTGLASGTTYYFVAESTGANGTTGYSSVMNFTTTGTPTQGTAPVLSSVTATPGSTSVTITWTTDQASNSLVNFGTTTAYGSTNGPDSTYVTSHSVTITGLTPGTTYDFDVVSTTSAGLSGTSANYPFATTSTVSTPPTISNVQTSVASTSVTITWTTDQNATTQVKYGMTTTYGQSSTLDSTLLTSHSVTVTGLTPNTQYDFAVVSANSTNQFTTSPNATFTTTAAANCGGTPPTTFVMYSGCYSSSAAPAALSGSSATLDLRAYDPGGAGNINNLSFTLADATTGTLKYHIYLLSNGTGTYTYIECNYNADGSQNTCTYGPSMATGSASSLNVAVGGLTLVSYTLTTNTLNGNELVFRPVLQRTDTPFNDNLVLYGITNSTNGCGAGQIYSCDWAATVAHWQN